MSSAADEPRTRQNPFSSMAVAKITTFGDSDTSELTIETDAVRRAYAHLDEYLSTVPPDNDPLPAGEVIVIVGDYGTGKTHLAMEMVRRAKRVLRDPTRALYLDTTADNLVVLYRRFMDKLGLEGVRVRVSEYYARIVAQSLEGDDLGTQFIDLFQHGNLTPQEAVNRLGLMESTLLREVQATLRRITDNEVFGTALTLLLRTGFDGAVWDWLMGKEPAQVLVERGIIERIDTEDAALEAMGVIALLYGRQHARFVLVIDEMERILASARTHDYGSVAGFQKLLQVFAGAGACLVLSGLPEFHDMLDDSTKERVSHLVKMSDLTTDEVSQFIKLAQKTKFGRDEITPFTEDTIGYLRNLAGGNARKVIRLCHETYRVFDDERYRTNDEGLLVTDEMVREAARRKSGSLGSDDIHGVVRSVLHANGWHFLQKHLLGTAEITRADFWLTFDGRAGGCSVLISGSILAPDDASTTAARIAAVRAVSEDAVVVLIVNGMLAESYRQNISAGLAAEPLVYAERGFTESFRGLVAAVSGKLPLVARANSMANVEYRLEQINRQQADIYDSLRSVTDLLDDAQVLSERRLAAIEQKLRMAGGGGPLVESISFDAATLPPEVDQHFLDAMDALAELTQIDAMMADVFLGLEQETINQAQGRLAQNEVVEATGVAFTIRAAVQAFRVAITDWQRTMSRQPAAPTDADSEQLDIICQRYDDAIEFLPVHKLWPLIRLAPWQSHINPAHRQRRYQRVQDTLVNLSLQIRRSMGRAAATED